MRSAFLTMCATVVVSWRRAGHLRHVALAASLLVVAAPAAATSCAEQGPYSGRFVHPHKTWLPANARGALFFAPEERAPRPEDFWVTASTGGMPLRATVERVPVPPLHILTAHIESGERLWRIGVAGGFKPGVRYAMRFDPRTDVVGYSPPVEFLVGPARFDTARIRPALAVAAQLDRVPREERVDYGNAFVALQEYRVMDASSQAGLSGGLTVLIEKTFDGQAVLRTGFQTDRCGGPVRRTLDAPERRLAWEGCPMAPRVTVRAWLGMLEVDERFVAAPPMIVHRSDSPFGACSAFGRTLDQVLYRFGL